MAEAEGSKPSTSSLPASHTRVEGFSVDESAASLSAKAATKAFQRERRQMLAGAGAGFDVPELSVIQSGSVRTSSRLWRLPQAQTGPGPDDTHCSGAYHYNSDASHFDRISSEHASAGANRVMKDNTRTGGSNARGSAPPLLKLIPSRTSRDASSTWHGSYIHSFAAAYGYTWTSHSSLCFVCTLLSFLLSRLLIVLL